MTSDPKGLDKGSSPSTLLIVQCVAWGPDFLIRIGPLFSRAAIGRLLVCKFDHPIPGGGGGSGQSFVLRDLTIWTGGREVRMGLLMKRRGVRNGIGVHELRGKGSRLAESCVQKTRTLEGRKNELLAYALLCVTFS